MDREVQGGGQLERFPGLFLIWKCGEALWIHQVFTPVSDSQVLFSDRTV